MGLKTLLSLKERLEVVAELERGEELIIWLDEHTADVVLLDIRMPGLGGIETARCLREKHPELAIILLTTFEEENNMVAGLRIGVSGYLLKDVSVETLVAAIERVAQGERYIHPRVSEVLAEALEGKRHTEILVDKLTPRETEVLALITNDLSNKRIAEALGLSEATVKAHISSILSKLNVSDRRGAVAKAVELSML